MADAVEQEEASGGMPPFVPFDPSEDEEYQARRAKFDKALEGYVSAPFTGTQQCQECGRIFKGPATEPYYLSPKYPMPKSEQGMDISDEVKQAQLHHVDAQGKTYNKAEGQAAGLEFNISHGDCPDCGLRKMQIQVPMRKARHDMEQWADEVRPIMEASREKSMERVEEAYQPVAEAYQSVPEAHQPVEEAHQPVAIASQKVPMEE